MSKKIKILTLIVSLLVILYGSAWLWFVFGYTSQIHEKPDFDLFIAEKIYSDYDTFSTSSTTPTGEIVPHEINKELPHSIWESNPTKILPIKWLFEKNDFEKLDTLDFGIKNISGAKVYYMSWGSPNSRLRTNLIIYKSERTDTIPFNGFGCGTGIYLEALENNTSAIGKIWNPLCYYPGSGSLLNLESDTFPKFFNEIYGDSVKIQFYQATYNLPWSKNVSQMIKSPQIIVSTKKVLKNWEKRNLKK